ncbi:restriction endonuclease subunit S [Patescibacteria group bacterium]|nr:restriction endonuclease subunit S [Patescibacteria group bacterium]
MTAYIADIGDIILGHSFRIAITADGEGNFKVLQAKNIKRDGAIELHDLTTTFLEKTRTQAFVKNGDVLLSNRGTFRAALYRGEHQNLIAASSVYIIRIYNTYEVMPEYLTVFLNSIAGQYALGAMNRGTLIKSLPKRSLSELLIPIPTTAKQKLIVDIYRNYQNRAKLYGRKTELEETIANQVITSLFSH